MRPWLCLQLAALALCLDSFCVLPRLRVLKSPNITGRLQLFSISQAQEAFPSHLMLCQNGILKVSESRQSKVLLWARDAVYLPTLYLREETPAPHLLREETLYLVC